MLRFVTSIICATVLVMPGLASAQDRPQIIAVNKALQYFAERLVEDSAEVVFPVPEGVDPSFWRPSISDISAIQAAELILLNGAGFATWIDRVSLPRSRVVNTTAAVEDQFIVTESITHSHGDGGEHSHEGLAAYTWLDPMLAIAQAESIASAVIARDLAPEEEVEARLENLRSDLTALDAATQEALVNLQDAALIATHPRYQYFERRYGLAISSLEWEAGVIPGEGELAELKALLEEVGASVLIWEAAPPQEAIGVMAELGLQSVVFAPWAGNGAEGSFIEAYAKAISDLSQAVSQGSN